MHVEISIWFVYRLEGHTKNCMSKIEVGRERHKIYMKKFDFSYFTNKIGFNSDAAESWKE